MWAQRVVSAARTLPDRVTCVVDVEFSDGKTAFVEPISYDSRDRLETSVWNRRARLNAVAALVDVPLGPLDLSRFEPPTETDEQVKRTAWSKAVFAAKAEQELVVLGVRKPDDAAVSASLAAAKAARADLDQVLSSMDVDSVRE